MTLRELRKLYFEMKREVFSTMRCGFGCDEEKMDRLLQKYFGKIRMDEEVPSKYVIVTLLACMAKLLHKMQIQFWYKHVYTLCMHVR